MDSDTFRRAACESADFIAGYLRDVGERPVLPSVAPGYLHKLLPSRAPEKPEPWADIMKDVQDKIVPGLAHWQHPHFHAYFPGGSSYPSMLAEFLSAGLGSISFSWIASPVLTELETVMVDWVGRMMNLPKELLPYTEGCSGGGVIQASSSECTLVCMFAARTRTINRLKEEAPDEDDCILLSKLVAYFSEEAHSSVEKAANISFVKRRSLPTDGNFSLRGETLRKAIETDEANGLVPFFVCGTMGTTSSAAVDNIEEIGEVCRERDLWLHIDGAYGGNSLICPEFQYLLKGFQHVTSFNYNPVKWMHVGLDCSVMWVRNKNELLDALSIDRIYYMHSDAEKHLLDYRNWTIPLSRRFRALKLWFVIRTYGVEGLQEFIRSHVSLAKLFETLVGADDRFEVVGRVEFGLVCFRLKGENKLTDCLLQAINESGQAHMIPTTLREKLVIRFTPANWYYSEEITRRAWDLVTGRADQVLARKRRAAQRFQALLAKYKDRAQARRELSAAGRPPIPEGEAVDSWTGVLRRLGYLGGSAEPASGSNGRASVSGDPDDDDDDDEPRPIQESRRRLSFQSMNLQQGDNRAATCPRKPSQTLFT